MPVLFIGHGSPMNAIENNIFTISWQELGKIIPKPKAILTISAHWTSKWETLISGSSEPKMIYDMYGFPDELYRLTYPAKGNRGLAERVSHLIPDSRVVERGFDHGVWSTLMHIYPDADVSVTSMSIDIWASPEELMEIGKCLQVLRDEDVLIVANGNIVHNLMMLDWSNTIKHPWAIEFDTRFADAISKWDYQKLIDYKSWWNITVLSHPTEEHILPIFPLLWATTERDSARFYTPEITLGSLSMRSVLWSE